MINKIIFLLSTFTIFGGVNSCTKDVALPYIYKAKNVVIIVIDGPRYSETFGDTSHQNIPELWNISQQGVLCTQFMNDGVTNTINGMSAITTGNYGALQNNGAQMPEYESIFQKWIEANGPADKAWIISSKDKLAALNNCTNLKYANRFLPNTDCGNNGLNTGYREDSVTAQHALNILNTYSPTVTMITFKDPDAAGHTGVWQNYIDGIKNTSKYTKQIVDFLNTNPNYKNNTAIFITNDHGRHLNGIADSFVSHGDYCMGCKHISLLAIGPDFKVNATSNIWRSQKDITNTVAAILSLKMKNAKGEEMVELRK